jgi:acyl-CoA hydrolase
MTVHVSLSRESTPGAPQQLATSGEFVMVAVDEHGKAVPIDRALPAG